MTGLLTLLACLGAYAGLWRWWSEEVKRRRQLARRDVVAETRRTKG
jgi:hypothetical protein